MSSKELIPFWHSDTNTIVPTYTSLQEIKRFLPYVTQDVRLVTQHVWVYYEWVPFLTVDHSLTFEDLPGVIITWDVLLLRIRGGNLGFMHCHQCVLRRLMVCICTCVCMCVWLERNHFISTKLMHWNQSIGLNCRTESSSCAGRKKKS